MSEAYEVYVVVNRELTANALRNSLVISGWNSAKVRKVNPDAHPVADLE